MEFIQIPQNYTMALRLISEGKPHSGTQLIIIT